MGRLFQESGQTPKERAAEARVILFEHKLLDHCELMLDHEAEFVRNIAQLLDDENEQYAADISPKRLFWLRDLREKYVD